MNRKERYERKEKRLLAIRKKFPCDVLACLADLAVQNMASNVEFVQP